MGNKPYIYSSWLQARTKLLDVIWKSGGSHTLIKAVDEFFDNHVTEYGQSVTVSEWEIARYAEDEKAKKEIAYHRERKVLYNIAELLMDTGAFCKSTSPGPHGSEVTTYRVLVMNFGKVMVPSEVN